MNGAARRLAAVAFGGLLGLMLATGVAVAEDWTPPPGAPPGCQPPPGECFPPSEPPPPEPVPQQPAPEPSPVPEATQESSAPQATPESTRQQQPAEQQGSGQQGSGEQEYGDAPTISIADVPLRVGEATPVPITIGGIDPNDDPVVEASVTITGGVGEAGGVRGSTLTFEMRATQLAAVLAGLVVTPETEDVGVALRAYPKGRPSEAISAGRSLRAAAASPTPSPSPSSAAPTVTAAPQSPTAQPSASEAVAAPSPRPTASPEASITLTSYDPLERPERTVDTTVAAVALLGVTAVAAGGALTGLAGASAPGGASPQGPSGGADSRAHGTPGRREVASAMLGPGDSGSFLAIDANLGGLAAAAGAAGARRRRRTWGVPLTGHVDRAAAALFGAVVRVSPLGARMVADSTYLRAMLGSAAVLPALAGLVLGVLAVLDVNGLALAPAALLLGLVIFLGTLDALAGFLAVAAFTVGIALSGGITGASSVRTLLGLAILGFGPALIAGASRPMRRPGHEYSTWERIADFVVIPLVGAFAVQGTIKALPALSGYDLPIAQQASTLALVALAGLVLRVSLEEVASRFYVERIAEVAPPDIPEHGVVRRLVLIAVRTALFGFVAAAFIGTVWQLWVGLAVFAAAELCVLLAPRMPNSPALFHAVPVGVPRFVVIVLAAIGLGTLASLLLEDDADIARTSFVLLLLPGLALAALGMFAKQPRDGDVRWYMRPSLRTAYRIGGILMIIAAVWLTQFAPTT
jgi:hypothetical protein